MNIAVLAVIITNLIWGASPPIYKLALLNIPPFTLAFLRFLIAGWLFLPLALMKWQPISRKDILLICASAFFGITVNITFFFLGLQRGISINSTLIASAGPVFIFILAVIFLKEKFRPKVFFGMIIGLLGVLIIVVSPLLSDGRSTVGSETLGNIMFVVATLGAVVDPLIAKKALQRVNFIQFTCIAFLFAAWTFFPLSALELRSWSFSQLNFAGLVGIVYGAVLASAIAYSFLYYGISKIAASEIGLFMYIDPVMTVLVAIPLLGEYPTRYYFLGAVLVFVGIYIAENRIHWHPVHKLIEKRK